MAFLTDKNGNLLLDNNGEILTDKNGYSITDNLLHSYLEGSTGGEDISDSIPAYLISNAESIDSQSTYLSGKESTSNSIIAYLTANASDTDFQPAFLSGNEPNTDFQPAYLIGQDNITDNQLVYLIGKTEYADSQPSFLSGKVEFIGSQSSFLSAQSSLTDSQSNFLSGKDSLTDSQSSYLFGVEAGTDFQHVFLLGKDTLTDSQPAFLHCGTRIQSSQFVFLESRAAPAPPPYVPGTPADSLIRDTIGVTINGNDVTSKVLRYVRDQNICTGIGTLELTLVDDDTNYDPWDIIIISENGQQAGKYYAASVERSMVDGTFSIRAQDNSKRLMDYFISENYIIDYETTIIPWINQFAAEAGVNVSIVSLEDSIISKNSSLGMTTAYEQIMQLVQYGGGYFYFNPAGTLIIGKMSSDTGGSISATDSNILSLAYRRHDSMLRNRAVVWGTTNPDTGEWIFADISRQTPWNYDSRDQRAVVFSNSTIYDTATAYDIARKILNAFASITFEKDISLIGVYNVTTGGRASISSSHFKGSGIITSLSVEVSPKGMITNIILDEKCPRLFAYWGYPPEDTNYVYIGTTDSGVWRKPLDNSEWEYFGSGIPSGISVTDLYINDDVFVSVTESGMAYYTTETGGWVELIPSGVYTASGEDFESEFVDPSGLLAVACTINHSTNDIIVGYNFSGDIITDSGMASYVVVYSGGLPNFGTSYPVYTSGEDLVKDYGVYIVDIDTNDVQNILCVTPSGLWYGISEGPNLGIYQEEMGFYTENSQIGYPISLSGVDPPHTGYNPINIDFTFYDEYEYLNNATLRSDSYVTSAYGFPAVSMFNFITVADETNQRAWIYVHANGRQYYDGNYPTRDELPTLEMVRMELNDDDPQAEDYIDPTVAVITPWYSDGEILHRPESLGTNPAQDYIYVFSSPIVDGEWANEWKRMTINFSSQEISADELFSNSIPTSSEETEKIPLNYIKSGNHLYILSYWPEILDPEYPYFKRFHFYVHWVDLEFPNVYDYDEIWYDDWQIDDFYGTQEGFDNSFNYVGKLLPTTDDGYIVFITHDERDVPITPIISHIYIIYGKGNYQTHGAGITEIEISNTCPGVFDHSWGLSQPVWRDETQYPTTLGYTSALRASFSTDCVYTGTVAGIDYYYFLVYYSGLITWPGNVAEEKYVQVGSISAHRGGVSAQIHLTDDGIQPYHTGKYTNDFSRDLRTADVSPVSKISALSSMFGFVDYFIEYTFSIGTRAEFILREKSTGNTKEVRKFGTYHRWEGGDWETDYTVQRGLPFTTNIDDGYDSIMFWVSDSSTMNSADAISFDAITTSGDNYAVATRLINGFPGPSQTYYSYNAQNLVWEYVTPLYSQLTYLQVRQLVGSIPIYSPIYNILRQDGEEFTVIYSTFYPYDVELSRTTPTTIFNVTESGALVGLPVYETFTNDIGDFSTISLTYPSYDLRLTDFTTMGGITMASGELTTSGDGRYALIASHEAIKGYPVSLSGDSITVATFSGDVNHLETSNNMDYQYIFAAVMVSGEQKFYQKDADAVMSFYEQTPSGIGEITIVRLDDRI